MASNNIKGITIEIGGNTTKLNDALKDTNKVTKNLQSELRGVNTLLKTDPSNVVLLTQKQELLTKAIQETESKLDVLKEAERQVQEQFARGEVSEEQYRNLQREIIATEQRLQNFRSQQEAVNDSFSKLTAKISEQESELETLRRRYSNYILDGEEASEEARDLANRINELSNELNENRTRLNSAAQATEELSESEEEAGEQAEESSGGFTILKGTLANMAADAIPKLIDAFKELTTESEEAMSSVKAATGSSAIEMSKYKDVLYEVYSGNYGDSLQDVADTMTIIIQQMGDLDNSSLQNITTGALMLRDTFGFDVPESIRATKSMMKQFGVTADEAYNLIVQGAQKGLNQNDDLLDTVNEYSVQFSKAGYSADDMFNMLQNGAYQGTWSIDKLGDAVKEFGIRMTDGTANDYLTQIGINADEVTAKFAKGGESAKEATQEVMKALLECQDPQQQYIAGQGLMGTMWEDLGVDAVKALMDTEGAINSTNEAMNDADTSKYDTISSKVGEIGRTLKTEILQPIIDDISPVIHDILDFCIDNMSTLEPIILGVASALGLLMIIGTIEALVNGFQKAFLLLNTTMLANPIVLIVTAITGLIAAIKYLWDTNEEFRNAVISIWEKVKSTLGPIIDGICAFFTETIPNAWNSLVEWFQGIPEWWKETWQQVSDFFQNIWQSMLENPVIASIVDTITNLWNNAVTTLENIWTNIKTAALAYWELIKNSILGPVLLIIDLVTGNFTKLKEDAQNIWDNIKNAAITIWNALKDSVVSVVEGFVNHVVIIVDGFKNTFSEIWENIKDFVVNTASNLKESAVNAFKNMVSGIKEKLSGLGGTIKDGFNESISFIKSLPNKALGWGKDFIDGFVKGIKNTIGKVKDAVEEVGDKIRSFLHFSVPDEGPLTDYETWMPDFMEGLAEGINNSKWKVTEAIKDLSSDMKISMQLQSGVKGSPSTISTDNSRNITQNVTINSPKELSPAETARRNKQMLQELALQL